MKLKNLILFMMAVCLIFIISACDSGLRITGIEIATYPHRLIYVVGIDSELDLSGGTVHVLTRDRSEPIDENLTQMANDWDVYVTYNIDFNVPGIYSVYLRTGEVLRYFVSFPIQVVSLEELEKIIESGKNILPHSSEKDDYFDSN